MPRYQTTFTFNDQDSAMKFRRWLEKNQNDRDYGHPLFVDQRDVHGGICIEYSAESDLVRGVATGIDFAR